MLNGFIYNLDTQFWKKKKKKTFLSQSCLEAEPEARITVQSFNGET